MNAKMLIAGLAVAAALLAQPPRGPRGFGPGGPPPDGPGFRGPGGPPPNEVVAGAPYSGVEVHSRQQVLANGTVIQHQEQTKVARDAQGRVRRETTRQTPDGKTETRIMISDPVAGMIHELDPTRKMAFSRPTHFGRGPRNGQPGQSAQPGQTAGTAGSRNVRQPAQASNNTRSETLASRSMNGVIATGTRTTHTIPAGTIGNSAAIETVHERWFSEDLKVPVKTVITDPRNGTSTSELTNLLRGDPDASLFTIPSDFTVNKAPGGPGGRGPRGGGR